ncbi:hypothetical protein DITRI_Ditri02bG0142300 [Diplodiscus trichospermus]
MPTVLKLKDDGHPHQLVWGQSEVPFFCDGCKELGFGLCYYCPTKNCDFILHEECGIRRPPPFQQFFKKCSFEFHKKNPLQRTRVCDACALDIKGFLYQCSSENPHDLHPCCANLPVVYSLPDTNMEIYLCKKIKNKCLKCNGRKRSSGKVQGLAYVSSDGKLCYHVACLREALFENWKKGYLERDVIADDENKSIVLQNLAPKEVVISGRESSKAMKGIKWLVIFLKLVVSAIFGEPLTLISTLFQFYQN